MHNSTTTQTVALLPLVKGQVFCIGSRCKMVKHKAWTTTIVVPKSARSRATKGEMRPTFMVLGPNCVQCRREQQNI